MAGPACVLRMADTGVSGQPSTDGGFPAARPGEVGSTESSGVASRSHGSPESDDRGPQLQDHERAEGRHATCFEEGQYGGSPRRRGRADADASEGCDETERNDEASAAAARLIATPAAVSGEREVGVEPWIRTACATTGLRPRRQEAVAHRAAMRAATDSSGTASVEAITRYVFRLKIRPTWLPVTSTQSASCTCADCQRTTPSSFE